MESYSIASLTKRLYDSELSILRLKTLKDILGVTKEPTVYSIIKRLEKSKIIKKIERDHYVFLGRPVTDFEIASSSYTPSYISFESALNSLGILPQFPYEITSATSGKSVKKKMFEKLFTYTHLNKSLFWGYEKKENYLIAEAEKALLDQLYLVSKGIKTIHLEECDFSSIKISKFIHYSKQFPRTRSFETMIETVKKHI
ncbi:hypothetical protein A3D77_01485 [Candidatus Gottesmanbacteria bacterium RIFCSPHIGHO2_02_FULL_39_11]|uniref:Uncharacterized protein n=1 Tax=Candidatus Gottesmanbacteria bacterium RIFCSPHIGHO2_02_FULL_39_11 TaxID=1798382 RepID=A0A1F5ZTD8_9BACT|nr:MAG: hypothetical protein A3D77_01485 [Candidatus Gottesmanbacteria bacterium RIFCSPHIGHO2_02_FULL_39_11]